MKRVYLNPFLLFFSAFFVCLAAEVSFAQSPPKMSYQAVIVDAQGNRVANQNVGMRISILNSSNAVYIETHSKTTSPDGMVSLEVGGGSPVFGSFLTIAWSSGSFFLKTETDITGGSNYTITGISQLLSVPYSFYSNNGAPPGGQEGQVLTSCSGVPTWTFGGQCPGAISQLDCQAGSQFGTLTVGIPANGVSSVIQYTGGNGGAYPAQFVASSGVTGLTAELVSGSFNLGPGFLTYNITGTPSSLGTATFTLNIGGQTCEINRTINLPVGTITALECFNANHIGTLTEGVPTTTVTSSVPYTGGNGGTYIGQNIASTGVLGLTASYLSGTLDNGAGSILVTINGIPQSSGTASFTLNIGGRSCTLNRNVNIGAGTITTLNCAGANQNGSLTQSSPATSVQVVVPYLGGNGGTHSGQIATSTGVVGLTATLAPGTFAFGAGNLTYVLSGTPASGGTANFNLNIGGKTCSLDLTVNPLQGLITALNCSNANHLGVLSFGSLASGVSSEVPYSGGNGGVYSGQTISSTGVPGLTATLASGSFVNGQGILTYQITGTPQGAGTASFALNIGGQNCVLSRTVNSVPGTISSLNCLGAVHAGTLTEGVAATSAVTSTLSYSGSNGGTYASQGIPSTGVAGLTANLQSGTFINGTGNLLFTISGTPLSSGTASFNVNIGGQSCAFSRTVNLGAGTIGGLNCAGATNLGTLNEGVAAVAVESTIPYTGGNGGAHTGQTVTSTGVLGLTATLPPGSFTSGSGSITYIISGTPATSGVASFLLNIGGLTCSINLNVIPAIGSISSLDCAGAVFNSSSIVVPYIGGNGGPHNGQTVSSTGITGITATLAPGSFVIGSGSLTYVISGAVVGNGVANFAFNIGGKSCVYGLQINQPVSAISNFLCGQAAQNGILIQGIAASGVSSSVPYQGGNGGSHAGQTVASTGVTGLTATVPGGNFANGSGNLVYTITGTPASTGTASFALNIGGQSCTLIRTVNQTGTISSLICGSATNNGPLIAYTPVTGADFTVPYTGGNGGIHSGQIVNSAGVVGLVATVNAGNFAVGSGSLYYEITGTPQNSGTATFALNIGGRTCTISRTVTLPAAFVSLLNCPMVFNTGSLWSGTAAGGVTCTVPYLGGNGGTYVGQNIPSSGVLGLTATLNPGTIAIGSGGFQMVISGTPLSSGAADFLFSVAGQSCVFTLSVGGPQASVAGIQCPLGFTGTLNDGVPANGVTFAVPYTGGTGGSYNAQTISSTGVTGLTASLPAGTLASGSGILTYTISGVPSGYGSIFFSISFLGRNCSASGYVRPGNAVSCSQTPTVTFTYAGSQVTYGTVVGANNLCWLDRNLGASQVAASSSDAAAYGDLFQWGRAVDGHQARNSAVSTILSSTDQPSSGSFISISTSPFDWRSPQNGSLWLGVSGINNPCPGGWRLPTVAEFEAERLAWSSLNLAGGFSSPLKLTATGSRSNTGNLSSVGTVGFYWAGSSGPQNSGYLYVSSGQAYTANRARAYGHAVRCVRND